MRRETGSTSVIVMALLLLLSVLFAGAVLFIERAAVGVRRAEERDAAERRLAERAGQAVALLLDDPTPAADSRQDPVWLRLAGQQADGLSVALEDLSSRPGLNWVRKELLEELRVLRPGRTADELQQFREDTGPHLELRPAFSDFIGEESLDSLFTGYGYYNINVSDEFTLRRLFLLRRADPAEAEAFHALVQGARVERKTIGREELRGFLGEDRYPLLFPVVNAEPPLNAHFVPERVLRALFARYEVPAERAERLLGLRDGEEWGPAELEALIGERYRKTALHQYLGVRTWFWRIRVTGPRSSLTWTLARLPPEGDTEAEDVRLRLLEESLEP